jgi:hypothetical protein
MAPLGGEAYFALAPTTVASGRTRVRPKAVNPLGFPPFCDIRFWMGPRLLFSCVAYPLACLTPTRSSHPLIRAPSLMPSHFTLRYSGRKWVHQADEYMATIAGGAHRTL